MNRPPWPPTDVLWALGSLLVAGGIAALLVVPDRPWGATALGAGLAVVAVALDRELRLRDRGAVDRERRQRTGELGEARAVVARRPVLTGGIGALLGALGLAALGALARYGPRPETETGWAAGVRLVGPDGEPLRRDHIAAGGIATAWPEGPGRREIAAVLVVRLPGSDDAPSDDVELVAYSRICTHAGCPVALFRAEEGMLYCPCHQATFDATRGAKPVFGPASRPLPRLPIGTDGDGYLVARGDLEAPPGPGGGSTA